MTTSAISNNHNESHHRSPSTTSFSQKRLSSSEFLNPQYIQPQSMPAKFTKGHTRSKSSVVETVNESLKKQLLQYISFKVVGLCIAWYTISSISNSLIKVVLTEFKYPVMITEIQFMLCAFFCLITNALVDILNFDDKNQNQINGHGIKFNLRDKMPKGSVPKLKTSKNFTNNPMLKIFNYTSLPHPTKSLFKVVLPMGTFQFVGHLSSHYATSQIPVSVVNIIKSLSPFLTVLIYRIFYKIKYSWVSYACLIPLVFGVGMVCLSGNNKNSKKSNVNQISNIEYINGLINSFFAMLIFVLQNVYAKNILTIEKQKTTLLPINESSSNNNNDFNLNKINNNYYSKDYPNGYNENAFEFNNIKDNNNTLEEKKDGKIDKLTILFYCSIIGFTFTLPVLVFTELPEFLFPSSSTSTLKSTLAPTLTEQISIPYEYIFLNGLTHFIQSQLAFHLLGTISSVSYSIASLLKRIVIIVVSIILFDKGCSMNQSIGVGLTCVGLYCWDRWGGKQVH